MAIFWGLIALALGWWVFKIALALFGAGLGMLFGSYVWDEESQKFVKK